MHERSCPLIVVAELLEQKTNKETTTKPVNFVVADTNLSECDAHSSDNWEILRWMGIHYNIFLAYILAYIIIFSNLFLALGEYYLIIYYLFYYYYNSL